MNKVTTLEKVLSKVQENQIVMIGGFLGVGTPDLIIEGLLKTGVQGLTVIANDTAFPDRGIGKLIVNKQIKKIIVSHIGTNPETGRQMNGEEIEVELVPQGTLAERIRAGGGGLGGILTPTGIGTIVEIGKTKIELNNITYLLETALKADVALIKAYKADESGNLVFRGTTRNLNLVMATAADYVIAEVEEIVSTGEINPEEVILPGIFVDAIIKDVNK